MENNFRKNTIEFAMLYLGKNYIFNACGPEEFDSPGFTYFIFQQLFNLDINEPGFGLDNTTKQMTNDIGNLKIYAENDPQKKDYLEEIKPGDLLFFHTQSKKENQPTPNNHFPGHVGLYLGDNKFIHASQEKAQIAIEELTADWQKILVASRDIFASIFKNS